MVLGQKHIGISYYLCILGYSTSNPENTFLFSEGSKRYLPNVQWDLVKYFYTSVYCTVFVSARKALHMIDGLLFPRLLRML